MTAIAYKSGILAADTQQFSGNMREGHTEKIVRRADGALAGASGRADLDHQFLELFKSGGDIDAFRLHGKEADDFGAVVIEPNGAVWLYTDLGKHPSIAPWQTLGSAYQFLHGALAAGASAEEAVRLAIEHTAACGGEVTVLRLDHAIGAVRDERIDPADWPVHERLKAMIRTDQQITFDSVSSHKIERTTSWGNNLHLQTRKKEMGKAADPSNVVEIPGLIGRTWGTNGIEETENAILEGNPYNLLTLPIWRPGMRFVG